MTRWLRSLSTLYRWGLQPLLVLGILVFGYLGARGLAAFRKPPVVSERAIYAPLVRVIRAERGAVPVVIEGNGTLEARTRIELVAQVGGRIVAIHPGLRAGGLFAADETLVQVEATDYELAVSQADADLAAVHTGLAVQRAEAEAARAEWHAMHPDAAPPTLLLREPQIQEIEARETAARSRVAKAQLDLERTRLHLPFAGRVVRSSSDVGQVVVPGQSVATVLSLGALEVPVPVEPERLGWITLPDELDGTPGSSARVIAQVAGERVEVQGSVVRIEAELETTSRLARVVVSLDPRSIAGDLLLRLLPGMFVDVEIDGGTLREVTRLPRAVVREGGKIWTVVEGRLYFAEPQRLWSTDLSIVVRGLGQSVAVVESDLEVVVEGMQVRLAE